MGRNHSSIEINELAEFQKLISDRGEESELSMWLGSGFPCMSLLVKGETAYMCYFPSYDHPGYISQNGQNIEGSILINESDQIEVPLNSVITVNAAIETAREYFETTGLPKNTKWLEL